jgi:3-deoxy-7-phosphoheptulonate synthase/chorismate mutase
MTDATLDPVLAKFREEITALDVQLVTTINERLAAVEKLRRYKSEQGIPFRDPAREEWMLQYLKEHNPGPLSDGGLDSLYRFVLDLVKEETDG